MSDTSKNAEVTEEPVLPSRPKQSIGFYVALGIAFLAMALAAFFAFQLLFPQAGSGRDPNAATGLLEGRTQEEVQAELNRIVDEGMFNISIANTIFFVNGESEGEVRIENVPGNRSLMKVEITRDDTGDVLYTSGLIEPNSHIQTAKLRVDLDEGTYDCTALFSACDLETEEVVGKAAAKVRVVVQG